MVLGLPTQNPKINPKYTKPSSWITKANIRQQINDRITALPQSFSALKSVYEDVVKDIDWDNLDLTERDAGVVDEQVVTDALSAIRLQKNSTGNLSNNFYMIYLFGVHVPLSMPKSPGFFEQYQIDTPYIDFHDKDHGVKELPKDVAAKMSKDEIEAWQTKVKNTYRNAVRGADYQFGRFVQELKDLGEYDKSVIVLVSDHGEYLFDPSLIGGDKKRIGHCCNLYKANTDVPIAFKFPRGDKKLDKLKNKNRNMVSHVDIFPSIIDFLGFDQYQEMKDKFFVGQSIFRKERNCSIAFNPSGYGFSILGESGEKIALLPDKPGDILNSTGFRFKSLKTYTDQTVQRLGFGPDDQKEVFDYVYKKYPECLTEAFVINQWDARDEISLETEFANALKVVNDRKTLPVLNRELVCIDEKNPDLWFDSSKERVLVATVVGSKEKYEQILAGNDKQFYLNHNFWVTAIPELASFCKKTGYHGDVLETRIRQYLGLPPSFKFGGILEFWAPIENMGRPCSDSSISSSSCASEGTSKMKKGSPEWLRQALKNIGKTYPFTGLGYTFDWGAAYGNIGASEFLVKKGTRVRLESIRRLDEYCGQQISDSNENSASGETRTKAKVRNGSYTY